MFTAIVTCPRRVKVAHTFSSCMTRQQTLGRFQFSDAISPYLTRRHLAKFFTMPPGKKAPPQQSSLTELWGKPKKQSTLAVPADASSSNPQSKPRADSHSSANAAGPTTSLEERAYCFSLDLLPVRSSRRNTSLFTAAISKRKQETATDLDSAYARVLILLLHVRCVDLLCWFAGTISTSLERHGPLQKRRKRVIEEDEEDEDEGPAPSSGEFLLRCAIWAHDLALPPLSRPPEAPSRSLSPAPSASPPPPKETQEASSSKATSRRSKAEAKKPRSTTKKGKPKAKAAAAVDGEDVEMHDGDKEAVDAKSDPPEENNDSGEEELEDAEERKAASKRCVCKFLLTIPKTELSFQCASCAGSKRRDGCRRLEGRRSVCSSYFVERCVADILLVYPMLRWQTRSHSSRRLQSG